MRFFMLGAMAALIAIPLCAKTTSGFDDTLNTTWVAKQVPAPEMPTRDDSAARQALALGLKKYAQVMHPPVHIEEPHIRKQKASAVSPQRPHARARVKKTRVIAQAPRQQKKLNAFDVLGMLPDPVSTFIPMPNLFASYAGSFVGGAAWSLITTAASTSIRENRELSNSEACAAVLGNLPFIGMLPVWNAVCKMKDDTCYNPEYVTYLGLRDDDPAGRFGRWVKWMQKYCKDVDWRVVAPKARAYIASTSSPN